jgi:hypothetical protein
LHLYLFSEISQAGWNRDFLGQRVSERDVFRPQRVERELLYRELNRTGKIESHLKVQLVKPLIGNTFIGDQFFTDGNAHIISGQERNF